MRAVTSMFLLLLAACQGPDAPDPAVCRDYIHRVCIAPVCAPVVPLFPMGGNCEATLQMNSGCVSDSFTFTTPTRERFLSCRLPLLRTSANVETKPNCEDVAESFDRCQDVVRLLQGIK